MLHSRHFLTHKFKRPVILKIHNDLLMNPMNRESEMEILPELWKGAVTDVFKQFAPIFIGYDGHDHTLRDLLENIDPSLVREGFYWGWYVAPGESDPNKLLPREEICKLIEKFGGRIFVHHGLDHLMWHFQEAFALPEALTLARSEFKKREQSYSEKKKDAIKLLSHQATSKEEIEAIKTEAERQSDARMPILVDIWRESDPEKRLRLIDNSLTDFPGNEDLLFEKAYALSKLRKPSPKYLNTINETICLYRQVLSKGPNENAEFNLASELLIRFELANDFPDLDEATAIAERWFEREPLDASVLDLLAGAMKRRSSPSGLLRAASLLRRAIEIDPSPIHKNNLADVLVVQFDKGLADIETLKEAETLARSAVEEERSFICLSTLVQTLRRQAEHKQEDGQLLEAANLIKECLEACPDYPEALAEQTKIDSLVSAREPRPL